MLHIFIPQIWNFQQSQNRVTNSFLWSSTQVSAIDILRKKSQFVVKVSISCQHFFSHRFHFSVNLLPQCFFRLKNHSNKHVIVHHRSPFSHSHIFIPLNHSSIRQLIWILWFISKGCAKEKNLPVCSRSKLWCDGTSVETRRDFLCSAQ